MPKLLNHQTKTVYRHGAIYEENHFILTNPTSNFKIVAIKKDRNCAECSKLIKANSRCYTINPKGKGRCWVCFDCIPEHDFKEEKQIGSNNLLYSDEKDEWGRHKSYGELTQEECEYFKEASEIKIEYEALSAALNDF